MKHKVYVSPSVQENNVGVAGFETEEQRMQAIGARVKYYLEAQAGKFDIRCNKPEMTLGQIANDSDSFGAELHVAIHSNAGAASAVGTEVYYHGPTKANGYKIAQLMFDEIAPMSPGADRGVKDDHVLYDNGLYELRETSAPAALIEVGFHTNVAEATWIINETEKIALGIARAICKYFGVQFVNPHDAKPEKPAEPQKNDVPAWKTAGVSYLKAMGYIGSDHDPLEVVDFGTLGTILKNYDLQLAKKLQAKG